VFGRTGLRRVSSRPRRAGGNASGAAVPGRKGLTMRVGFIGWVHRQRHGEIRSRAAIRIDGVRCRARALSRFEGIAGWPAPPQMLVVTARSSAYAFLRCTAPRCADRSGRPLEGIGKRGNHPRSQHCSATTIRELARALPNRASILTYAAVSRTVHGEAARLSVRWLVAIRPSWSGEARASRPFPPRSFMQVRWARAWSSKPATI